jgi:hypothetical protein
VPFRGSGLRVLEIHGLLERLLALQAH